MRDLVVAAPSCLGDGPGRVLDCLACLVPSVLPGSVGIAGAAARNVLGHVDVAAIRGRNRFARS